MAPTRKSHYVPQFYLKAWTQPGKKTVLYCLQKSTGKIFPSTLDGVANRRDFYKLVKPSEADLLIINQVIYSSINEELITVNQQILESFLTLFIYQEKFLPNIENRDEAKKQFLNFQIQFEESYHNLIESDLKKYLDLLLKNDLKFVVEDHKLLDFFVAVTIQYMRTPKIRNTLIKNNPMQLENSDKSFSNNVLSHIFANNLAWDLYMSRKDWKIILLINETEIQFITGDQPIINTLSKSDGNLPIDLEYYYPISPNTAILITRHKLYNNLEKIYVNEDEVNTYNGFIFAQSHEQIYAVSENNLLAYQNPKGDQ